MPDCVVPPPEIRCEAMTKAQSTYQEWRREPHRCVRKATRSRAGRSVCALHDRLELVEWWNGQPDNFRHRRFWKWPRELDELARAVVSSKTYGDVK